MIIIKPTYKILDQNPGVIGIYEQAEFPGRICYGSQDKILPGTAEKFCNGLMKSNHGAPLEHGTVYLHLHLDSTNCYSSFNYPSCGFTSSYNWADVIGNIYAKYNTNKYSKAISKYDGSNRDVYITTNLRVLFENNWMDDLQWQCEPTEYHEKRITVEFKCDIGVSREYNRHRNDSINEESTRYCNLTKEKFGSGNISFICPPWINNDVNYMTDEAWRNMCGDIYNNNEDEFTDIDIWLFSLKTAEYSYNKLINLGWKPQQARTVLPLATKTSLIHTAFISDWINFFNLRALGTTGLPHPQAKELAEPLMNEFINRKYINKTVQDNSIKLYF